MTRDELTAQLIEPCRKHLSPGKALLVGACLDNHTDEMWLRLNLAPSGEYTESEMAELALRCALEIVGSAAN